MEPLILHEDPISANCYKIRLVAALLALPIQRRRYSILKGETRTPEFLDNVSTFGRIPVLQIGESTFLPESNAACFYLADRCHSTLIPSDSLQRADMLRWMFFEQNQHEVNIATLRFWIRFIGKENLEPSRRAQLEGKRKAGEAVLDYMAEHLKTTRSGWFVGEDMTLADVCLYAYTHVAREAEFDLAKWPTIQEWCARVEKVEGYVKM